MLDYYLLIGFIYAIIGFAIALIYYFLLRKPVFGRFMGALIVALVGSFFGGVIEYLFADIIVALSDFAGVVNIFPPLIVSIIFITIFSNVSAGKKKQDNTEETDS